MNEIVTDQQELESIIGFKLNEHSIQRINELRLRGGFDTFIDLISCCVGTLEIFLKERIKDRVFVTLDEKYISDLDNWDKKVWMFDIEFLNKSVELHARHLEVVQGSRIDEPDYNLQKIAGLLGKDNYEDLIINSIVLVEWVVTEIGEGRIIGSVTKDEVENMDSSNWRILVLYNTISDLGDYKYSWDD
ncbi:MAG: hypothetical protein GTN99_00765 [Candidatus Dadabacteria bacterium]|nr:hypothetical protein [Candidatus Dadabacteria bacterium]NIT12812.1 hypothetical protein [Candidatus Dadabacteria bacterium]